MEETPLEPNTHGGPLMRRAYQDWINWEEFRAQNGNNSCPYIKQDKIDISTKNFALFAASYYCPSFSLGQEKQARYAHLNDLTATAWVKLDRGFLTITSTSQLPGELTGKDPPSLKNAFVQEKKEELSHAINNFLAHYQWGTTGARNESPGMRIYKTQYGSIAWPEQLSAPSFSLYIYGSPSNYTDSRTLAEIKLESKAYEVNKRGLYFRYILDAIQAAYKDGDWCVPVVYFRNVGGRQGIEIFTVCKNPQARMPIVWLEGLPKNKDQVLEIRMLISGQKARPSDFKRIYNDWNMVLSNIEPVS